ncbi:MAG TPA: ATPase, T2SS/T4P/T4SS family, partial [Deltaproteobacteria bacterium]|nr:ATPase, T2SS/T4P/T4SS family [Deltaproteobacteria bacterium]
MRIPSLEQALQDLKLIDQAGLEKVRTVQLEKALPLQEALLASGAVSDHDILQALSKLWDIPLMIRIEEIEVDPAIVDLLPMSFLRKYLMVPVKLHEGTLLVAVNDPADQDPMFDIARLLKIRDVKRVLAPKQEILSAINRVMEMKNESAKDIMEDMEEESDEILKDLENIQDITLMETEAPIIRMVNRLMVQAYRDRASDIHVEPYQTDVKVRYRIDGILHDVLTLPKRIHSPVVSRIKIMASLNIAEKRLPQDGRIGIKLGEHSVDLRISVVPTVNGERVVMRILDKSSVLLGLEELGFYPDDLQRIERLIRQEHGIILVTGPTGS